MVLPQRNPLKLSTGWLIPYPVTCCNSSGRTSGGPPWSPASMELWGFFNQIWYVWNRPKGLDNIWEAEETQARRQWSNISDYPGNAGKKLMPQGRISLKSCSFMCSVVLWASQSWLSFKGEGGAESFSSPKPGELNGSSPLFADEGVERGHLPLHFGNGYVFMQKEGTTLPFFFFLSFCVLHPIFPRKQKLCGSVCPCTFPSFEGGICVSNVVMFLWVF